MIWSIDQDDSQFSALQSLVGKPLPTFSQQLSRVKDADTNHWTSLNGQQCKKTDCLARPIGGKAEFTAPPGWLIAPNGGPFQDNCGPFGRRFVSAAKPNRCR